MHKTIVITRRNKICLQQTCNASVIGTVFIGWRCGVAVECRTCDQEVACSSLSRTPRRQNSGQVSHTYVPLSPSSIGELMATKWATQTNQLSGRIFTHNLGNSPITWYRSKGDCLATGQQTNCGPCVGGRLKTV